MRFYIFTALTKIIIFPAEIWVLSTKKKTDTVGEHAGPNMSLTMAQNVVIFTFENFVLTKNKENFESIRIWKLLH